MRDNTNIIMRTSSRQFETIVKYMEMHGDLNRPTPTRNRDTEKKWEILTNILNNDVSGGNKKIYKWKKVWSDLKNNTKKKAAKIKQAIASGNPIHAGLHDLERLVLKVLAAPLPSGYTRQVDQHLSAAWKKPSKQLRDKSPDVLPDLSNDSIKDDSNTMPPMGEQEAGSSEPVTVYFMEDVDTTEITLESTSTSATLDPRSVTASAQTPSPPLSPIPSPDPSTYKKRKTFTDLELLSLTSNMPKPTLDPRMSVMEPRGLPLPVKVSAQTPSPPMSPIPSPDPSTYRKRKPSINKRKQKQSRSLNLMKTFLYKKLKIEQQKLLAERRRNEIIAHVGAQKVAAINRLTDVLEGLSQKIFTEAE